MRICLDQHLAPGSSEAGVVGAADVSLVNRAIGFLIGEGYHPDEAHHELVTRATAAGITVILYAAQLIQPLAGQD